MTRKKDTDTAQQPTEPPADLPPPVEEIADPHVADPPAPNQGYRDETKD